jgi:CheY-like chemotaxis protein
MTPALACPLCHAAVTAKQPSWCDCDRPSRTIVCDRCHSCFCSASFRDKRIFRSSAPPSWRESPQRFRFESRTATLAEPAAGEAEKRRRRAIAVLVVDDDESHRSLIACAVEQFGYSVMTAAAAEEAMEIVANNRTDIIVTDALMPHMDGREMARILKLQPSGRALKIVLLTSLYRQQRYRSEALGKFGVDAYMLKPVDLPLLARTLRVLAG